MTRARLVLVVLGVLLSARGAHAQLEEKWSSDKNANSHLIRNLPAPTAATNPFRLGDATPGACIPKSSGVNGTYSCAVAGAGGDYENPLTFGSGLTRTVNAVAVTTNGISNAMIRQGAANTLIGNPTGGTANVTDVTLGAGCSFVSGALTCPGTGTPISRTLTPIAPILLDGGSSAVDLTANRSIGMAFDNVTLTLSGGSALQRAALTGAITASAGSNATAFGALAGTSVLANATGSSAVPAALAASADGQFLGRVGGALVWTSTVAATSAPLAAGAFGFGSAGGLLTGDAANAHWDATNTRAGFRVAAPLFQVHLIDTAGASDRGLAIGSHIDALTTPPLLQFQRSRGSFASPTTVTTGTYGGRVNWLPYDGTTYINNFAMGTRAATISTGSVGGSWFVAAAPTGLGPDPSGDGTIRLAVSSGGSTIFTPNGSNTTTTIRDGAIDVTTTVNSAAGFNLQNKSTGTGAYTDLVASTSTGAVRAAPVSFFRTMGTAFSAPDAFQVAGALNVIHLTQNAGQPTAFLEQEGDWIWASDPGKTVSYVERMKLTNAGAFRLLALGTAGGGHVSAANTTGLFSVSPTIPYADISGAPAAITATTGDVVATGPGSVPATIQAGVVSNSKLRNSGALSLIGRSVNTTGSPADISASAGSDCVYREGSSTIACGTVATAGIANSAVTLAKQADIATARLMGRVTAGTGVQEVLTGTQATTLLDAFTSSLKGLAPASGGGSTNFLRADGTWAAPPGVGGGTVTAVTASLPLTSSGGSAPNIALNYDATTITLNGSNQIQAAAMTGAVTKPAGSNVTTIPNNSIVYAQIQNLATDHLLGRDSAGAGSAEEISLSTGLQFTGAGSIGLANAGAGAGSCTYCSAQFDAQGREVTYSSGTTPEVPLTFSTGLTRSGNTITANLSTGVSGGQTAIGGIASGNALTLSSTSNATKGKINLGTAATSYFDEAVNKLTLSYSNATDFASGGPSVIEFNNSNAGTGDTIMTWTHGAHVVDAALLEAIGIFYLYAPGSQGLQIINDAGTNTNAIAGFGNKGLYLSGGGVAPGSVATNAPLEIGGSVSSKAIYLGQAATQIINKHGGQLTMQTDDANALVLGTNGTARVTVASGGGITASSLGTGIVKSTSGLLANATTADIAAALAVPGGNRVLAGNSGGTGFVASDEILLSGDQMFFSNDGNLTFRNTTGTLMLASTNHGQVRTSWSGNTWSLASQQAGTGTLPDIKIDASTAALHLNGGNVYADNLTTNGYVQTGGGVGHLAVIQGAPSAAYKWSVYAANSGLGFRESYRDILIPADTGMLFIAAQDYTITSGAGGSVGVNLAAKAGTSSTGGYYTAASSWTACDWAVEIPYFAASGSGSATLRVSLFKTSNPGSSGTYAEIGSFVTTTGATGGSSAAGTGTCSVGVAAGDKFFVAFYRTDANGSLTVTPMDLRYNVEFYK